ncbi:uncharacterized protein DUF1992 [Kineococcus xinjiangensis]|uniref:Uncharacterized protein DUF1992 n=1 Tax=Kineococcus xinjiangensis TaxID=512762 RepID=A0A2S6IE25_9ACTN|nr:DUF1992 domain-containing protein [Kineococcus xinjiangensis]PPK92474.1 uncharacterized protein DUF1992 [Kineococcus xinjiangensis]
MSQRKPAGRSFESWTERLIREAQERGEFDALPGAGKPIPGLDQPFTPEDWAAGLARREGLDLAAMLPPHLAFRRERAALRAAVPGYPSAADVREAVEDFNARLLREYRRPQLGTPLAVALLDVDEALAAWSEANPPPPPPPAPEPAPPRSRWWQRLRERALRRGR